MHLCTHYGEGLEGAVGVVSDAKWAGGKNLVFNIGSFLSISRRGGRVFLDLNMVMESCRYSRRTAEDGRSVETGGG